ncbi:DUF1642 domain-containing protein [Pediococcus pentosaceus]|uniref:DUF1642 domain-containing protein n=1 Tax=Pediococcus pentosaceus TaxID=1255 RepID=UPI00200C0F76|nr:DUF1642 domain-containing protein [Pediococcus pentosaceus]UQA99996.1 DUF1642 domain-containing protein [Pediococcus pentosaceus]UQB01839.1 DUF1642 domain-containing protein [Pediococcus pentosaceus]
MTKDEYVKELKKYYDENKLQETDSYGEDYAYGLAETLTYAIGLAEQLDEPEKVVIPKFIANDIKYHKKHGSTLRGILGSAFAQGVESDVCCWFYAGDGDENVRKCISAWDNGYEVEKEKKYRVKLPGMIGDNGQQYLSRSMDDKLFACAFRDYLEQEFTKEELEKFPDWIQLLEFKDVEDD